MFICDNIQVHNINYKLEEKDILAIFKKAQDNRIRHLGIVETKNSFVDIPFWLRLREKKKVALFFFKEFQFPSMSNKTFYILFRNQKEYNAMVRLHRVMNEFNTSPNEDEVLLYLQRFEFEILLEKDSAIIDIKNEQMVSKNLSFPLKKEIVSSCPLVFENHPLITDLDALESPSIGSEASIWLEQNIYRNHHELHSPRNLFALLETLVDWKAFSDSEVLRLKEELKLLRAYNQEVVFLAANSIKQNNLTFAGNFKNFLLSFALNLCSKEQIIAPLETGIPTLTNNFIVKGSPLEKFQATIRIKSLLEELGYSAKHPFILQKPLYSSLISMVNEVESLNKHNHKKKYVSNMMQHKEKLDDLKDRNIINAKEVFFEEMKLYFLLNPEELEAFEFALSILEESFYYHKSDYDKLVMVPIDTLFSTGEKVYIDSSSVQNKRIPYITWSTKETPLQ